MKIGIKAAHIFALCFVFAAQTGAASAADKLANIKSVGIISALGDCLNLRNVDRISSFFNAVSPECVPIQAWGIDEAITKQISEAVANRFAVKPIAYDPAAFYRLPWTPVPGTLVPVKSALQALTNPGVDAYIVVTKMAIANAVGDGNDTYVEGLGIGHQGSMFGDTNKMFAVYTIRIIDAHSYNTLETEGAHLPKTGLFPRVPIVDVDASMWSNSANDMTEAQKAAAKEKLTALVHESIGSTLHYMDLAP